MNQEQFKNKLNEFLNDSNHLSDIMVQYLKWNAQQNYETNTLQWLYSNVTLVASLENKHVESVLASELENRHSYYDVINLIKSEEEIASFNQFTNVVPLFCTS
ncbi:hypothetical protein AJ85_09405 [Alkalihalobacillus alcalophilus ATCC 27647 = CGMCC 1.3604]|uniref:Uncharacterized protein n=1 Tax=Alkalihalobacillus alcalophilus ATCC 27647 = CGMCC 1.3604 TaxID=1218173 RepID=A0A094WHI3_ALKAL|nr:hypothetical protein [Alkalihalobacillus alcalophilus]KGA96241.1 hypothetical protein BALCAV_0217510 [Alkalihalobacillus alcalophilus ATCC 27647 = CGMCC 1.3604]MED1560722.1 hypothetical protein [Alkalihalobacillus alcalophilus]THG90686.1 hypothetical protein AJ85_09405 [Alkalihalobacillus alcalophilus ATCC 27647 = CGMCC 1.3604]